MNNLNLSDDKLNTMLGIVGKKLGQDPEQLKQQLEQGKLDNVLSNMNPKTAGQINGLLQNPKALEAMLNNPQVQGMLSNMLGGQK